MNNPGPITIMAIDQPKRRRNTTPPPPRVIHGLTSRRGNHYLYNIWKSMKRRCLNPRSSSFCDYGGRGILMAAQWVSDPRRFHNDVICDIGERPSTTHSIDRILTNGNYEPGNIRWATDTEQQRNKRCNVFVPYGPYAGRLALEVADELGISRQAIVRRIHLGLPAHEITANRLKSGPARCRVAA